MSGKISWSTIFWTRYLSSVTVQIKEIILCTLCEEHPRNMKAWKQLRRATDIGSVSEKKQNISKTLLSIIKDRYHLWKQIYLSNKYTYMNSAYCRSCVRIMWLQCSRLFFNMENKNENEKITNKKWINHITELNV